MLSLTRKPVTGIAIAVALVIILVTPFAYSHRRMRSTRQEPRR